MNKRFKGSGELSDDNSGSENLLAKLTSKELKSIKVTVPRHDVLEPTSSTAMQRTLEDPNSLIIHRREGEGQHPIFDRKGIVVNDKKHLKERIVKQSPLSSSTEDEPSDRSRSNSYSERSVDSYRSGSSKRRDYSKSPSRDLRKDSKRKSGYSKDYHKSLKVSPYKGKQKLDSQREEYREKRHFEKGGVTKKITRSVSPSYRKSESERGRYDSRNRAFSKERYYKDKSPKPSTSRASRERERSPKGSRDRETEAYRKDKYKSSPRRVDYRDGSPKRYDRNRSRSHSPRRIGYKPSDKEKYSRIKSPPVHTKRYSISPHSKRRSRSPYIRKHSPSPHSKRRSRSPHFKRSSPREDRGYSGPSSSGSKIRRRSGSPYDRERDYPSSSSHPSGHGKPSYSKRRSRSPYYRKYSRSPHRTESSYKYKRRSRSPYRRDSDGYRPRSRSPSKRLHKHSGSKERNYRKSPSGTKTEYEVLPPEFNYYGAEGFWIPGPMPRPYIPRGVIPSPVAIPRGMIRPGPYIFPRPYMPLPPHPMHQFRPRFPSTYNRPPRPRLTAPTTATITADLTSTSTETTATITESTSTVAQPTSSTQAHSEPSTSSNATLTNSVVEEPSVKSENPESSVRDKS